MRFDFDVRGGREAGSALMRMGDRAADIRPAGQAIRRLLMEGHKKQYATRGSFLGTPWPANAPGTIARKGHDRIMEGTGDLRRALEGGRGRVSRVTRTSVVVGTRLHYLIFHLKQTPRLPARPAIGMNDAQRQIALGILERHVVDGP